MSVSAETVDDLVMIPALARIKNEIACAQNKESTMDTLTPILARYVNVSKKLTEINANASELRDTKRTLELDLAAAYASKALPDKIELKESKMMFVVKRPNQWKKGWSLSKKTLEYYLNDILPEPVGKEVMMEIIKRHEKALIEDDYGFELRGSGSD